MLNLLRSCTLGATTLAALTLSLGCSTAAPTTTTNVWKDVAYAGGPMATMVVFGGRMDETNRRTLEDGMVTALQGHGVRAMASYRIFPNQLPDKEQARVTLQEQGIQGALVAAERGVSERSTVVPGGTVGGFWNVLYGPGWGATWEPGYVVTDQFVKFETSLWDLRAPGGKLVWSATTQTENPSSGKDFTTSLTKAVIPQIAQAGFIPPKQTGKPVAATQ